MTKRLSVPKMKETWTTEEAAERYGKNVSRISQVCRMLKVGTVKHGRTLTLEDIRILDRYFQENGRQTSSQGE